jgi:hypothetical protein
MPTTLSITWGTGPTTTSVPIPAGIDYSQATRNIFLGGGFWTTIAGVLTFIPASEISEITAQ